MKERAALKIGDKNIGDTVTIGEYYIDSKENKKPIEWIICRRTGGSKTNGKQYYNYILISKYIVDFQNFFDEKNGWNKPYSQSSIRQWLNVDFYNTAFSDEEKEMISNNTINDGINEHGYDEGSEFKDKVWLASYDEIKKWNEKVDEYNKGGLKTDFTNYAINRIKSNKNNIYEIAYGLTREKYFICRDHVNDIFVHACSLYCGSLTCNANDLVYGKLVGIRPCIWVRTTND